MYKNIQRQISFIFFYLYQHLFALKKSFERATVTVGRMYNVYYGIIDFVVAQLRGIRGYLSTTNLITSSTIKLGL